LIVDSNQVQVMMHSTNIKLGSADVVQLDRAEPRSLYVLDADWSDLIEISDVTHTVYISFGARAASSSERLQPVVRNVFPCSHFVIIPPSRRRNLRVVI